MVYLQKFVQSRGVERTQTVTVLFSRFDKLIKLYEILYILHTHRPLVELLAISNHYKNKENIQHHIASLLFQ